MHAVSLGRPKKRSSSTAHLWIRCGVKRICFSTSGALIQQLKSPMALPSADQKVHALARPSTIVSVHCFGALLAGAGTGGDTAAGTEDGAPLPAAVLCQLCEGPLAMLPHRNCANIDCARLFVACNACKVGFLCLRHGGGVTAVLCCCGKAAGLSIIYYASINCQGKHRYEIASGGECHCFRRWHSLFSGHTPLTICAVRMRPLLEAVRDGSLAYYGSQRAMTIPPSFCSNVPMWIWHCCSVGSAWGF